MGEGPLARFSRTKHPVARDEGLLVEELADEMVVYDERTKEAHCLSPLAAVVFAHCDGRTTIEELTVLATQRLGEPIDDSQVLEALVQLQDRDLLAVPPRDGLSRRQMIGKTAVAAGGAYVGTSLITSIVAPAAATSQTATCAEVLCCPCCTASNLNIVECCTTPTTRNCQCVQASQNVRPGRCNTIVSGGKFCKTTGAGAPTDEQCLGTAPFEGSKPPATWCTACYPFQQGLPPTGDADGACGPCTGSADPTCPNCPA